METVDELRRWIEGEIARRSGNVGADGTPFPPGIPWHVQEVIRELERGEATGTQKKELISKARNRFEVYVAFYNRPAPRVGDSEGKEMQTVSVDAKTHAPQASTTRTTPKKVAAKSAPRKAVQGKATAKAAPKRARKLQVWEDEAQQEVYLAKYPWAIEGSFAKRSDGQGTTVKIECQAEGCSNVRKVFLADLFQVKYCGPECRKASRRK